jgi:hypothetical protein
MAVELSTYVCRICRSGSWREAPASIGMWASYPRRRWRHRSRSLWSRCICRQISCRHVGWWLWRQRNKHLLSEGATPLVSVPATSYSHIVPLRATMISSSPLLLGLPIGCIYRDLLTGWTIGILGFDSRRGLGIFIFTTASRTALGPTQPPIQWVPGAVILEVKRLWRKADHSPPSSAEVKECVELYLHSQYTFMTRCSVKENTGTLPLPYLLTYLLTYSLTPWYRIFFEELVVTQLVKEYSALFMEPEGSLPCSQKPTTGPYPEPAESSSPHRTLSP